MQDSISKAFKRATTTLSDDENSLKQAQQMVNLTDTGRLREAVCQDPLCNPGQVPLPHRHPVAMCKGHTLCVAEKFNFAIPEATKWPQPTPHQIYKTGRKNSKEPFSRQHMDCLYDAREVLIEDWELRQKQEFKGLAGSVAKGTKLVVTPYQLDQWIAQNAGLRLEDWPANKKHVLPDQLEVFHHLEKKRFDGELQIPSPVHGFQKDKDRPDQLVSSQEERELKSNVQKYHDELNASVRKSMDSQNPEWATSTIFVHPATKQVEHERAATLVYDTVKTEKVVVPDDKKLAQKMIEETRDKPTVDDAILNPSLYVRTRMSSPGLTFMDKGDIQRWAVKFQKDKDLQQEQKQWQQDKEIQRSKEESAKRARDYEKQSVIDKKKQNAAPTPGQTEFYNSMKKKYHKEYSEFKLGEQRHQERLVRIRNAAHAKTQQLSKKSDQVTLAQKFMQKRINSAIPASRNSNRRQVMSTLEQKPQSNSMAVGRYEIKSVLSEKLQDVNQSFARPKSTQASTITGKASTHMHQTVSANESKVKVSQFIANDSLHQALLSATCSTEQPINLAPASYPDQEVQKNSIPEPRTERERRKIIKRLNQHCVVHRANYTSNVTSTGKSENVFKTNLNQLELQHLLTNKIGVTEASTPLKLLKVQKAMLDEKFYQEQLVQRYKTKHAVVNQPVDANDKSKDNKNQSVTEGTNETQEATVLSQEPLPNQEQRLGRAKDAFLNHFKIKQVDRKKIGDGVRSRGDKVPIFRGQPVGIGANAEGKELAVLVRKIKQFISNEMAPLEASEGCEPATIHIHRYELDCHEQKKFIQDMTDVQFWLQQALEVENKGQQHLELANQYYRKGLLANPRSLPLIYNLARNSINLRRYSSAIQWLHFGLQLKPRWVNGLAGMAVTFFECGDFASACVFIRAARDNFKGTSCDRQDKCLYREAEIRLLLATMLRGDGQYDLAAVEYGKLQPTMAHYEKKEIEDLLLKALLLLMPQNHDRKLMMLQFEEIKDYFTLIDDDSNQDQKQDDNQLLLEKYCFKPMIGLNTHNNQGGMPLQLDLERCKKPVLDVLATRYFFRRFKKEQLAPALVHSRVQTYAKGDVVYLKDRIGVVTHGSAMVKNHPGSNLCKPRVLFKAVEGHILGFQQGETCGSLTCDPLTWIIAHGSTTEILWFRKKDFLKLWELQKKNTEKQLILTTLDTHPAFKHLSIITKYQLIYETMQEKKFFPGEEIVSMAERSSLNKEFTRFYEHQQFEFFTKLIQQRKDAIRAGTKQHQHVPLKRSNSLNQGEKLKGQDIHKIIQPMTNKKKMVQKATFENHPDEVDLLSIGPKEFMLQKKKTLRQILLQNETTTQQLEQQHEKNHAEAFGNQTLKPKYVEHLAKVNFKRAKTISHKAGTKHIPLPKTVLSEITKEQAQIEHRQLKDRKHSMDLQIELNLKLTHEKQLQSNMYSQLNKKQIGLDLIKGFTSKSMAKYIHERAKVSRCRSKRAKKMMQDLNNGLNEGTMNAYSKFLRKEVKISLGIKNKDDAIARGEEIIKQEKKALQELVKVSLGQRKQRVTAHSLLYINSGEVAVFNQEVDRVVMTLQRGSFLCESYLTRNIAAHYVGSVIAGLRPLSVFEFPYYELDRVLTFPEKALLQNSPIPPHALMQLEKLGHEIGKKRGMSKLDIAYWVQDEVVKF